MRSCKHSLRISRPKTSKQLCWPYTADRLACSLDQNLRAYKNFNQLLHGCGRSVTKEILMLLAHPGRKHRMRLLCCTTRTTGSTT